MDRSQRHRSALRRDRGGLGASDAEVKKAIREKVLESYRNGLKAQPRNQTPVRRERGYAQAQAR